MYVDFFVFVLTFYAWMRSKFSILASHIITYYKYKNFMYKRWFETPFFNKKNLFHLLKPHTQKSVTKKYFNIFVCSFHLCRLQGYTFESPRRILHVLYYTFLRKGDFVLTNFKMRMTKCNRPFQASTSCFSTCHIFSCRKLNDDFAYIINFFQKYPISVKYHFKKANWTIFVQLRS